MLKLAKDVVSKNSIIFKVFSKKILEFLLCHQILGLEAMFFLVPLLDHCPVKKQDGKKDLIWPIGPNGFKIVFTLLAETIAV